MAISAAKGTAEILSPAVARIGEKENPAVRAALEARPELPLGSEDRAQDEVVLKREAASLAPAVPVRGGVEAALDFYDKKARVSLTMLTVV